MEPVALALLYTAIAGLATGLGSFAVFFIRRFKPRYLSFTLSFSAGVMIYVSLIELLGVAVDDVGVLYANIAFFLGVAFSALLDRSIPHEYELESIMPPKKRNGALYRAGMFVALGIALHNFPEGMVAFFGTLRDSNLGIVLLFAIALHNIPEGLSIAFPIYWSTRNRKKAFWWSFLSGVAEPVGALVAYMVLLPFLSPGLLGAMLAAVAGIMVYICFSELLPICFRHGQERTALVGVFVGMAVMAFTIVLLP